MYLFTHGVTGERLLQALKVNNGRTGWGRALDAIGGGDTGQPFCGISSVRQRPGAEHSNVDARRMGNRLATGSGRTRDAGEG